jgi:hypothetical protein
MLRTNERTITADKSQLLAKLQENREQHHATFLDAQDKYREKVIQILEQRLEAARRGNKIDVRINLPEPVDYTEEYDTAIEMVEWHQGDAMELSEQDFRRFVQDKWEWSGIFAANTESYSMAGNTYSVE